jgi:hypothetical protein
MHIKVAASLVATALLAPTPALAACKDCGTVAEVKGIKEDAANDKSTAAAVKAGAKYQVVVKMDAGKPRSFTFMKPPDFKAGDKVKVVNGMQLAKQ